MQLNKILFLDVETVSQTESYNQLNEDMAFLWREKYKQIKLRSPEKYSEDSSEESSYADTGLFAEFGKIACISMGFLFKEEDDYHLKLKSIYGEKEDDILTQFADILYKLDGKGFFLCGHNAREFDVPYIARRMIINNIRLPQIIQNARGKQWESPVLDTMEMWRFGDYKHYTSLKLLCHTLNIPSPKDDIDGKDVYHVFYLEHDLERIAHYCEKDVLATVQVFLRLNGFDLIKEEHIL